MPAGANAAIELRDIHLPDPVSWWPPAPGWWLLLLSLLCTVVFIGWLRRRNRAKQLMVAGLNELKQIERAYRMERDNGALIRRLSTLLRRISISRYPRHETAALTGENWLRLLDQQIGRPEFSRGAGKILATGPYQAEPQLNADTLLELCREWITALPPQQTGTGRRYA